MRDIFTAFVDNSMLPDEAAYVLRKILCSAGLKLLVWAHLSYIVLPFSPASSSLMALAIEQFHTEDFEQVVEAATSVQAIMGWSSTILVVAFRGSCSASNFISDAQVMLISQSGD